MASWIIPCNPKYYDVFGAFRTLNTVDWRQTAKSILDIDDLEIFENVAYIMAWHADPSIPGTIDEWLEDFEMFSIYEILPEILKLWGDNLITQVDVKKTGKEQSGNDDCSVPAALCRGRDFYPRSGPADDRHGSGYLCRKME